ncbi:MULTISPECIES: DUF1015 family protein [unclassified Nocardioides]|uniref:DUF1015 family protein n=1 Tax=unclassified Nocardioides TaxID=2615069 RepID=UPI0007005893|nr:MULTISPECIES: DUF1015 family protein [unclassified Nocardioides]KQY54407.1 hypothetical protein ASD30_17230 [Nocardioides sp. Root140]KRF19483.1 hypothetical protein ASH02_23190 [Nocardioides sp. Soil796]
METPQVARPHFDLRPFRALRLANSHVGDPASHRIFARPYRAVPARLLEWRRKRHLTVDPDPALYVHEYTSAGVTIRGLVALVDLPASESRIFAHEDVQDAQVQQLAHRMREMSLNPAPILLMHRGTPSVRDVLHETTRGEPQLVYTDRGDQLQRIWRITDPDTVSLLRAEVADTHAVIADGHHRYAAAQQLRTDEPGTGWDQTLVMLIDQADTPLQLCAIHRTIPRLSLDTIAENAREYGDRFRTHSSSHKALAKLEHALVLHDGQEWATLTPAASPPMLITWLHEVLLPRWQVDASKLVFHHSASDAITRAGHGVSVLLPAPTFDQVDSSALSGHLLPQKATSFQPKPHLGVLMRELNDE